MLEKTIKIMMRHTSFAKTICFVFAVLLMVPTYSQTPLPKNAKLKTIEYGGESYFGGSSTRVSWPYTATGYVSKGRFIDNQEVTFTYLTNNHVLNGIYHCQADGKSHIDGQFTAGLVVIKGVFEVANTMNRVGITTHKKDAYEFHNAVKDVTYCAIRGKYSDVILVKEELTNTFYLKETFNNDSREVQTLESSITYDKVMQYLDYIYSDKYSRDRYHNMDSYIDASTPVKLTYSNGDVFKSTVGNTYGTYYYESGEVFVGEIGDGRSLQRAYSSKLFIPILGTMTFADGSVEEGDWIKKYGRYYGSLYKEGFYNLDDILSFFWLHSVNTGSYYDVIYPDRILAERFNLSNLTELHQATIESHKQEQQRLQDKIQNEKREKIEEEQKKQEKRVAEQRHRNTIIGKYGEYWGELICKKEYTLGMTKAMVSEFTSDEFYITSKTITNGNSVEVWRFDENRMALAIMNKADPNSKEEKAAAGASLMMLGLTKQMGFNLKSKFPTLVFTNGKVTGVHQR